MSATSGITVTPDLATLFANANTTEDFRFIKVSIRNETLVHDLTVPVGGQFEDDLNQIQILGVLEDAVPAYILAKLAPSDWILVCYVPDSATVRDKMVYASTRGSLTKSLGSTLFTDTIFASSRADLTPEAYIAHKRHLTAPKPLSSREQDIADIRSAEYNGSRTRANHVGTGVELQWTQEVEEAIKHLTAGERCAVVVVTIDGKSEKLILQSTSETTIDQLGASLPPSEPCYAFLAWPHTHAIAPRREIIFIYSCPAKAPVKFRMVYSSGVSSVFLTAKSILFASSSTVDIHFASRKIETSDPAEINEGFLIAELGLEKFSKLSKSQDDVGQATHMKTDDQKLFARPRGPGRRR